MLLYKFLKLQNSVFFLSIIVFLFFAGCGPEVYKKYSLESIDDNPSLTPSEDSKGVKIDPANKTFSLTISTKEMGRSSFPAIQFNLRNIPESVNITKAELRLRRGTLWIKNQESTPVSIPISIMNMKKTIIVKRATLESSCWVKEGHITDKEKQNWESIFGFKNAKVIEFIPRMVPVAHNSNAGFKGNLFEYLKKWNPVKEIALSGNAIWDIIDITDYVKDEYNVDKSITFLIKYNQSLPLQLEWMGCPGDDPPWGFKECLPETAPYLWVEYAKGDSVLHKSENTEETKVTGQGKVTVKSTPSGAKVYLNNNFVGMTSGTRALDLPVKAGKVIIRIEKDGYKTWEETLTVTENANIPIEVELVGE